MPDRSAIKELAWIIAEAIWSNHVTPKPNPADGRDQTQNADTDQHSTTKVTDSNRPLLS